MRGRAIAMGGIIAAGEGSRLRRDGWTVPKPLVTVGGVPLIESVIRNLEGAGIRSIVAIVNEQEQDCVDRVRADLPDAPVRFIVKTTASSLESFLVVTGAPGPGPMLVSTVDAWCLPADFARFAAAAARRPDGAVVLAVTPFVADEKPLWVDVDGAGRVRAIGGDHGAFVTAGIYLIPEAMRRRPSPPGLGRLRELLAWMHRAGHPMYAEVIPTVVDVDRAEDVALAEALGRGESLNPAGGRA